MSLAQEELSRAKRQFVGTAGDKYAWRPIGAHRNLTGTIIRILLRAVARSQIDRSSLHVRHILRPRVECQQRKSRRIAFRQLELQGIEARDATRRPLLRNVEILRIPELRIDPLFAQFRLQSASPLFALFAADREQPELLQLVRAGHHLK